MHGSINFLHEKSVDYFTRPGSPNIATVTALTTGTTILGEISVVNSYNRCSSDITFVRFVLYPRRKVSSVFLHVEA